MQTPQRKLKEIQRLLSAFPDTMRGDPTLLLHNYLTAIEDYTADTVSDAVDMFLRCEIPAFDGRFAPTAPVLASGCRFAAEKAARANYLSRLAAPKLPPPQIEHTPEERERIRAMAREAAATLASPAAEHEAEIAARKEQWARVNARFAPDLSEEALAQRLLGREPQRADEFGGDAA